MKLQDILDALQEAGVENIEEVLAGLCDEINAYLNKEPEGSDEDKQKQIFGI